MITRWVRRFGRIEVGHDPRTNTFVRALDEGGISWSGRGDYHTLDDALRDMEEGIEVFLKKHGLIEDSSAKVGTSAQSRKRSRKTTTTDLKTLKSPGPSIKVDPEREKILKKVRKLAEIAAELRQGKHFPITRLTTIKSFCEDPKAAEAFALFLVRKVQKRLKEKRAAKRYRELVNRAVSEMKSDRDGHTQGGKERLWHLWHEMRDEQNEYKPISWGVLRVIKSMELLVAEKCLESVLRADEAPYWLYQAARDYAERYDSRYGTGLIPESAPMVEEIAGFWGKYLGVKK
jgi:hypothetical protein